LSYHLVAIGACRRSVSGRDGGHHLLLVIGQYGQAEKLLCGQANPALNGEGEEVDTDLVGRGFPAQQTIVSGATAETALEKTDWERF